MFVIEVVVIIIMELLWGVGFVWYVFGEWWGLCGWVGVVFILGGSLVI